MFLTSSNTADIKPEVKRSLYLRPNLEKGPVVYGRGDAESYRRFLRCGVAESKAVGSLDKDVEFS